MKSCRLFLFLTILFACFAENPRYPQLQPVDTAEKDSSFSVFRNNLIKACESFDSVFLYQHVAGDVMVHFGEDGKGLVAFRNKFEPQNIKSPVWDILPRLMRKGCVFDSLDKVTSVVCPYIHALFPDSLDPAAHVVLWEDDVPVLKSAEISADTLALLDYAILQIRAWEPDGWVAVSLPDGKTHGFVKEEYCYDSSEYRVYFEKRKGVWKITALVGGD